MNVRGMGVVFTHGRGPAALREALVAGWQPPSEWATRHRTSPLPAYPLRPDELAEQGCLKTLRRADRFSRMATLAAWDAVQDAGAGYVAGRGRTAVIVATAFGPHVTTFKFLNDILDYGDTGVSPTAFSHSVHNAAAGYVGKLLELHGPTVTLTQFAFPFHYALLLAQAWLAGGLCDAALVGAVDELGDVMGYICGHRLRIPSDGRIRPLDFAADPGAVPGEGAAFFLLDRADAPPPYGALESVTLAPQLPPGPAPDLCIVEADGLNGNESAYRAAARTGAPLAGYAPLYGSLLSGSGFSLACAAVCLRAGALFGVAPAAAAPRAAPRRIASLRADCSGRAAWMSLALPNSRLP